MAPARILGQILYGRIRQSKNALFDWRLNRAHTIENELCRKRAMSTRFFSTELSGSHIQSQKVAESTGCFSRTAQRKTFMNPWHRSSHHENTRTPTHTHTRYHTAVPYNDAEAGLAVVTAAAASRRESAWHVPRPARHQRVSLPYRSPR